MTRMLVMVVVLSSMVAGCATPSGGKRDGTPSGEPPEVPTGQQPSDRGVLPDGEPHESVEQPGKQPAEKAVNITPFTEYSDEWSESEAMGGVFSDAYTRLVIRGNLPKKGGPGDTSRQAPGATPDVEVDTYPYEPRGWLARYFFGKHRGINFTAKVTTGLFEATIPMVTIDHVSNSEDGEQWTRVIYHSILNNPWFLVKADGGNSVTTVRFALKGSEQYSSAAAASALQVALGVAKAVAPEASVVTSLSQQSTKDKSRAIDDAIGKLFGSGMAEEHWTDRDIRYWTTAKGAKVVLRIPASESGWDSKDPRTIGTWLLTFEDPRPSIFADWRICGDDRPERRCAKDRSAAVAAVFAEIRPAQVLSYTLFNGQSSLGTVHSYLTGRDWFLTGQAELSNNTGSASGFCRRIRASISDLGLSTVDSEIVVWAVVNGMPLSDAAIKALRNDEDCKKSLNQIQPRS